jgi:EAL and modified HD-GYP domain-containing signal transduction protein
LRSAVDAILDMNMQDLVRGIILGDEIRAALLGEQNKLRQLFDLALKYEMGCWEGLAGDARRMQIPERAIPGFYVQAAEWARSVLSGQ